MKAPLLNPLSVKNSTRASSILLLAIATTCGAASTEKETNPPSPDTLYLCRDGNQTLYTNTKLNKNCKTFALGTPISSKAKANAPSSPAGNASTNFPKVEESIQKTRDKDRKFILEEELSNEQKMLDQAKKELAQEESKATKEEKNYKKIIDRLQPYREKISQHERNLQAIRKEISITK